MKSTTMKKIILIAAVTLILPSVSMSGSLRNRNFGNATVARVTSVYDADTFRVDISGWPAIIGYRVPVRVNGVDAPEIRGKCRSEKLAARRAKQFTVAALRGAQVVELRNIRRGKYFRLVADVYVDGENLAEMLIKNGLARPYHGGKRQGWCD